MVEAEARAPWFLGERLSALDIYIAAMTRWRPGRRWFAEHTPKLWAIAGRMLDTPPLPGLAEVWARHYPPPPPTAA